MLTALLEYLDLPTQVAESATALDFHSILLQPRQQRQIYIEQSTHRNALSCVIKNVLIKIMVETVLIIHSIGYCELKLIVSQPSTLMATHPHWVVRM